MERLDAAADPRHAIERGLYVNRGLRKGRSLFQEIAGKLELRPSSTHLVLGGIGSGKTTQLLMAARRLAERPDNLALVIDVSLHQDISALKPQTLLVLAGLRLATLLEPATQTELKAELARLHELGHGYGTWKIDYEAMYDPDDEPPDDEPPDDEPPDDEPPTIYVRVPGVLKPPSVEATHASWTEAAAILEKIQHKLAARATNLCLLFDSMDRIVDPTAFERAVVNDLAVLRALKIGVVMVGPPALLYGTNRPIVDHFDQMHLLPTPDPADDGEREFLQRVLAARTPEGLLSTEGALHLVRLSGGVLRDLIGIARNAGEEAYLSGDEHITKAHADAAGEEFGRTLLLGLDAGELAKLQTVRTQGTFIPTTDKDLALILTGRILEYRSQQRGVPSRYAVHPTICDLLAQLAEQS